MSDRRRRLPEAGVAAVRPGVAIAIATANFPEEKLAPAAIIVFAVLSAFISIPFMRRLGRVAGGEPR